MPGLLINAAASTHMPMLGKIKKQQANLSKLL